MIDEWGCGNTAVVVIECGILDGESFETFLDILNIAGGQTRLILLKVLLGRLYFRIAGTGDGWIHGCDTDMYWMLTGFGCFE